MHAMNVITYSRSNYHVSKGATDMNMPSDIFRYINHLLCFNFVRLPFSIFVNFAYDITQFK